MRLSKHQRSDVSEVVSKQRQGRSARQKRSVKRRPAWHRGKRAATSTRPINRPLLVNEISSPYLLNYATSQKLSEGSAIGDLFHDPRQGLIGKTAANITRLMDTPDDNRRPDIKAHVEAHLMIVRLADLGLDVPADDVYSDPDRAIRLLWNRHDRNVELVFPPTETEVPYLYRSDEHEYQVEENPNPESVLKSIRRILGDVPPGRVRAA